MPTTAQAIASLEAQRTALAATYAGYIAELQRGIDSLVANYLRVFPSKTTAQAQAFLAAHDGSYSKCVYGISMYQQQYNTKDQALQAQIAALQRTAVGAGLDDEDTNEKPKPSRLADIIKAKQAANSKEKLADALRLLREAHKEQTALGSKNHEASSKLTSDTKSKNTEDTVKTLDAELKAWLHSKKTLPPKTKDAVSDGAPTTTWVSAASVGVVLAVCACVSVFAVMRRHRRQSESSEVYVTLA